MRRPGSRQGSSTSARRWRGRRLALCWGDGRPLAPRAALTRNAREEGRTPSKEVARGASDLPCAELPMPTKPPPLTPEVEQKILAYVRAGGYAHIAAVAAGIPFEVFEEWMRKGEAER